MVTPIAYPLVNEGMIVLMGKGQGAGSKATQFRSSTSCSDCGVPLTPENKRNGRCTTCSKKAAVQRTLRWRARHPERASATSRRTEDRRRGDPARTKVSLESLRRWMAENPDGVRKAHALKEARRRARCRRGEGVTKAEWNAQLEVFGHRCGYCLRADIQLTMDHVTPLVKGGPHEIDNVAPACRPCNEKKQGRGPLAMVNA